MPLTAPTFDSATPTFVRVGFSFIDANGGTNSVSVITTVARATDTNINAAATALGSASNANLWEIRKELIAGDSASPDGADEAPRESAKDVVNILYRNNSTRQTQDPFIPAPLDSLFLEESNNVDVTQAEYLAVETAFENLLDAAYGVVSTRFTQRKEINKAQKR